MSEHFEAFEADFQVHYGLDLAPLLWGPDRAGLRRILSLVRNLPPRSAAVRRLVSGGQEWTNVEELLAAILEGLDLNNRLIYSAYSKKGQKPWKPLKIDRPGRRGRRAESKTTIAKMFGQSARYSKPTPPEEERDA